MAEPFKRSEGVQAFLDRLTGQDNQATIRANKCIRCGGPAISFSDALSEREYAISGLCQMCQDIAFTDEPDDVEAPPY